MESSLESKNEEIIENGSKDKLEKAKMIVMIGILAACIATITTVFLIGYSKFGWFQKNQDNVIRSVYSQNQVLLFNEFKTISTEIETKNGKENIDQTIETDFMVVINSKKKLNYFGVIDYLYNATIVILKTKSNDKVVNDLDLTNKAQTENFLFSNNEHPLAKFSFYENGTLAEIYLSNDTNQFYANNLVDLIEKIIPRISKKIYNNKKNKNVEFSVEEEDEDKKTISEEHNKKEFVDKYSKMAFKGSLVNKRIKRKISNDTLEQVTSESELNLVSEKPKDGNFYDIGLDGFLIKVNSDLVKLKNKKDTKELIKTVDYLSRNLDFEESQKKLEELVNKEMGDIKKIIEESEKEENEKNEIRKLVDAIDQTYDLISINVLGKTINFKYTITYNNGKATHSLQAIVGNVVVNVNTAGLTATGSLKGSISAPLCAIPFTLGIPLTFSLSAVGTYDYSFVFKSNYKKEANIISMSGTLSAKLQGSLSTGAPFISLSVGAEGQVVGLSGSKSLDIYTRKFSGQLKATTGPISLYVDVKLEKKSYHKDLYKTGSISKNF